MKIRYVDANQLPQQLKQTTSFSKPIKQGYAVIGCQQESISLRKRIGLIFLCLLIVPLFSKEFRSLICKGREIVFYCSRVVKPPKIDKIDEVAKKNDALKNVTGENLDLPKHGPADAANDEAQADADAADDVADAPVHPDMLQVITKLLNAEYEELLQAGEDNALQTDFEASPDTLQNNEKMKELVAFLGQLGRHKAIPYMRGLLKNEKASVKFYISCIRMIHDNFQDNDQKKNELSSAVACALLYQGKSAEFWNNSTDYLENANDDGSPKPITRSLIAFYSRCLVFGVRFDKPFAKECFEKGVHFGLQAMKNLDQPHSIFSDLFPNQKLELKELARRAHPAFQ